MKLVPVGELGPVYFAVVEGTPLCAVFMQDTEMPFVPLACLVPAELLVLAALGRTASRLLPQLRPGFVHVLGQLGPRPRTVQLLLRYDERPMLLLALFDGARCLAEFPLAPESADKLVQIVERLQQHASRAPGAFAAMVEQVSEHKIRLRSTAGQVRDFQFVPEFSVALGEVGEYLRLTELAPGDSVRFFCQEGLLLHVQLQTTPRPELPSTSGPEPGFARLCQLGQEVDEFTARGRFAEAADLHRKWLDALAAAGGEVGPFLAAKWTLSLLYRKVRATQFKEAVEIWTQANEHPILVPGITCLEDGYVAAHDFVLYQLLTCCLRSLDEDRNRGVESLGALFPEIAEMAREAAPQLQPLVLRNWRLLVQSLCDDELPPAAAQAWNKARMLCPRPIQPRVLDFPAPAKWVINW